MKLTVLCDNHTYIDQYYLGEPAASYLIEDGDRCVLFDTGYSDVFIENARRMGIDLSRVTDIVLSHGHNDHTGGLSAFFAEFSHPVRLTAHPAVFRRRRADGLEVGSPIGISEIPAWVEQNLTAEPMRLSEHVFYLGEIPRHYAFEAERAVGEAEVAQDHWEADHLPDDTGLALLGKDGLFLVAGCAHCGICNMLRHAGTVTGESRISGIFGGMHLFDTDDRFFAALDELQRQGAETLYPCHCTSLPVKTAMYARFTTPEVGVGMEIEL